MVGCAGQQSILAPQSPEAAHLSELFWFFTAICGSIWVLVIIGLGVAISRKYVNVDGSDRVMATFDHARERRTTFVVGALVAGTTAILVVFTVLSYFATRTLAAQNTSLNIEVTGHQWWWEITYSDKEPSRVFQTANEIHLPVGKSVNFTLRAADVIHSFWLPNLGGKQDLIPGQINTISFTPSHTGIYRGQCAEFCGLQHAHMALFVIVQSEADFEAWRAEQLRPAVNAGPPQGEQVFFTRGCALCHTIRGTGAGGSLGPDLTHVATRDTLAAGTLPNSEHGLSAWLGDPQGVKPGNKMPKIPMHNGDLDTLEAYLRTLR
jgi:cytochrome c oxidase subunit 2